MLHELVGLTKVVGRRRATMAVHTRHFRGSAQARRVIILPLGTVKSKQDRLKNYAIISASDLPPD